jgi:outer membrane receptor protein involved in Fe transport
VDVNATSARQYLYYSAFFQDDWKVTRRLTLNLGLRWDYQAPVTERFNRQLVGFDYTSPSPLQVPGFDLKGGPIFAGGDGQGRAAYKSDFSNIQPRAGVAYEIRQGLVFRANYGRSYLPLTGSDLEGINQTGFGRRTGLISSLQVGIPFNTLDSPYPDGILQPFGSSLGLGTNIGSGISFINPDFKTPFVDQWMVGFDIELPWKVAVDISYVGNRTRKLPINGRAINEVPLAERIKAIERLGGSASYLSANVTNPFAGTPETVGTGLNNAQTTRGQLLRPYPQYGGITMDRVNEGYADYNALELTANKRLSNGLLAVFTYTLMKNFEETGYLNNGYDEKPWRSISSIDRTHRSRSRRSTICHSGAASGWAGE